MRTRPRSTVAFTVPLMNSLLKRKALVPEPGLVGDAGPLGVGLQADGQGRGVVGHQAHRLAPTLHEVLDAPDRRPEPVSSTSSQRPPPVREVGRASPD